MSMNEFNISLETLVNGPLLDTKAIGIVEKPLMRGDVQDT